jgi:hypothetical protein
VVTLLKASLVQSWKTKDLGCPKSDNGECSLSLSLTWLWILYISLLKKKGCLLVSDIEAVSQPFFYGKNHFLTKWWCEHTVSDTELYKQ